jgi:hypothetical protein
MNETTDKLRDDVRRFLLEHPHANRRMTYGERCCVFYALYWGYSRSVVCEAFSIHPTTASYIADCLTFDKPTRNRGTKAPPTPRNEHGNHLPPPEPTIHPENMRRKSIYQKIAREMLELGATAFGEKYFDEVARIRLIEAAAGRPVRKRR